MSKQKDRDNAFRDIGIAQQPTAAEAAYDKLVVEALNNGFPIQAALSFAGTRYPAEALEWEDEDLGDIAAHYAFLQNNPYAIDVLTNLTPLEN